MLVPQCLVPFFFKQNNNNNNKGINFLSVDSEDIITTVRHIIAIFYLNLKFAYLLIVYMTLIQNEMLKMYS